MVDFNRHFLQRKPDVSTQQAQKDFEYFQMIQRNLKIGIAENRLALIEVCANLLEAYITLKLEAIQCELS